ncbi:MAG TPA: BadF/BadG/BcrA/BcrD ATPase family protein, partial [Anaeromyxobacter sp.]
MQRYIGIDVGAETIKVAELAGYDDGLKLVRTATVPHGKEPGPRLLELLGSWDWSTVTSAAATGRLGRQLSLPRLPTRNALHRGFKFLYGDEPSTVVSLGSRGICVLEIPAAGEAVYRESSRCAQGTGNFLRQLVGRFGLTVEEAALAAEPIGEPAPLSGRCPVILKTDMTHLANKGERHERILAGLLDAIAESAEVLVKPRRSPPRVLLTGGVTRSKRVRDHFRAFLARNGMTLLEAEGDERLVIEAVGCAVHAAETRHGVRSLGDLLGEVEGATIASVSSLKGALPRVRRMTAPTPALKGAEPVDVVLGFDIGSTGSKAVAIDLVRRESIWEGYGRTSGDPVGAAQALMRDFLEGPAGKCPIRAFGATGSGREIVGSLLATCYGPDQVFVLNEIAAHAKGAHHYDQRVDTIFEIGGQDAKYVRLESGRVVDAAMNEACSAGTGSFIEEQGGRFEGVTHVAQLGEIALGSEASAALGQHCSIFMAEVIDEAVAASVPRDQIIAGLYESVIQNYLNRVKGSRSVGDVVFCQGMPFASDALAAAVARQTGAEVIVPPSPGTVGALGIALLAAEKVGSADAVVDGSRFLAAKVESKDQFVCKSTVNCGGSGNKCRIDRLSTLVEGEKKKFTWGGSCSLYDQGSRKRKLPEGSPDPFRARAERIEEIGRSLSARRGGKLVAFTDDFQLKGTFPFWANFLHGLGLDLDIVPGGGRAALRRGIEGANVPWCAPMQQYHGAVAALAERPADFLFVPMIREIQRVGPERASQLCPVVQGSPDVLAWDLGPDAKRRMLSPVVDVGPGELDAPVFLESCRKLAASVGAGGEATWRAAFARARTAQLEFDAWLLEQGRAALERA